MATAAGCVAGSGEGRNGTLLTPMTRREPQVNSRTRVSTSGMWMNVPCSARRYPKVPVLPEIELRPVAACGLIGTAPEHHRSVVGDIDRETLPQEGRC